MMSGHLAYATAVEHQHDLLRIAERERRLSRQDRSDRRAADGGSTVVRPAVTVRWAFHLRHPFHVRHGVASPR